jgi:probable F420-dependent oxidoreductase
MFCRRFGSSVSADGIQRVGAIIPNTGPLPTRLGLDVMAKAAESAGAESLWVSDHLLMVDSEVTNYPYSADGRPTWAADLEYYEALVCCGLIAAATTTCRVGTAVLILPQRNVLELAKVAASLDRLIGGRLALGVGAGWNEAEMEALGYSFAERGKRFDEMLDVLRDCWTGRPQEFDGRQVTVPPHVVLSPRPAQETGPPLLVGGMTDPALRRAATHGDGWLALAFASSWDAAALAERLDQVRGLRDGRPGGEFQTLLKLHATPAEAGELPRLAREAASIGFDEIIVEAPWDDGLERACETIASARAAVAQG